jgi:ubiquinone/menaquinone biosynthesis C-methylase UbiE
MLDELAHAGPEHLEAAYAESFDEKSPTDFNETVEQLVALGLDASSTVVDLGAGTGAFAVAVAPFAARVVAVDVSPAMVAVTRRRVGHLGLDNVEVVNAGYLNYEHVGEPADVVHSRNTLHQIPDFWKVVALRRVQAILRPGGVLHLEDLVFSFPLESTEAAVEAWLRHASPDAAKGWTAAEYVTHLREEYSTFSWVLEEMLARTGFEVVDSWFSDSMISAAYDCRRV